MKGVSSKASCQEAIAEIGAHNTASALCFLTETYKQMYSCFALNGALCFAGALPDLTSRADALLPSSDAAKPTEQPESQEVNGVSAQINQHAAEEPSTSFDMTDQLAVSQQPTLEAEPVSGRELSKAESSSAATSSSADADDLHEAQESHKDSFAVNSNGFEGESTDASIAGPLIESEEAALEELDRSEASGSQNLEAEDLQERVANLLLDEDDDRQDSDAETSSADITGKKESLHLLYGSK